MTSRWPSEEVGGLELDPLLQIHVAGLRHAIVEPENGDRDRAGTLAGLGAPDARFYPVLKCSTWTPAVAGHLVNAATKSRPSAEPD